MIKYQKLEGQAVRLSFQFFSLDQLPRKLGQPRIKVDHTLQE